MKLITRQIKANEASTAWKLQYSSPNGWRDISRGSSKAVYENLKLLGCNPSPDKVDEIIGNASWTRVPECDECGRGARDVIRIGEEPDYDSNTAHLCAGCLSSALDLMKLEESL